MKKILCIFSCLLSISGGKAQTLCRDQVRIEKGSTIHNEDNNVLNTGMDIVMQGNLRLSFNHVVTLTPSLESNGRTKILPSIVAYGRECEVANQRNNIVPSENIYSIIRRKHNKEQIINHHQQPQFEAWMCDTKMKLDIDVCGCCGLKEETGGELITRLNILPMQPQPVISYITPQAEIVRHRAIERSAFPDFPVSQIITRPECRHSTVKPAKICVTTNNMRNDDKATLSSARVHGYASPEGGCVGNIRLVRGCTQALVDHATSYCKFDNRLITSEYTPEDWEGFHKFVAVSLLEKKDEILRLMDDSALDIDKKGRQIAQLADPQTCKYILEECYPALRHLDYTVNYTVHGFNLGETKKIIKVCSQLLSLQEVYRIAESCRPGSEKFNHSSQVVAVMFSDDPIADPNTGAMEIQKGGDLATAKRHLVKVDQKVPEVLNNLGVIALLESDYDTVEKYFNAAKAGGLTTQANINIKQLKSIRNYPKG